MKKKILFDFADTSSLDTNNVNYDIKKDLGSIQEFEVVLFSHPHDDHLKGASDFFYLDHAEKYKKPRDSDGKERAKIKELWVSAAFLLDSDLENQSDAKIIRQEARHRLRNKSGIKVFATPNKLRKWLDSESLTEEEVQDCLVDSGSKINLSHLGVESELQVYVHAPFAEDSEEVDDKNTPSIVLQVRLLNGQRETNVFMTGDAPYDVLSRIVEDAVDTDSIKLILMWKKYMLE